MKTLDVYGRTYCLGVVWYKIYSKLVLVFHLKISLCTKPMFVLGTRLSNPREFQKLKPQYTHPLSRAT